MMYAWIHWMLGTSGVGDSPRPSLWMPAQASSVAGEVDWVFYFILYLSAFFVVLITALMVIFTVRYRRGARGEPGPAPTHSTWLEITWSVIPLILVVLIFWFAFEAFLDMATPPRDAYEIQVTAQKWNWLFTYPNGYVDAKLHVPVDRDVRLVMTSQDVIHSFFVPAFRVKKDVVPGRYNVTWFRATHSGEYPVFCAEYCGTSHSAMLSSVIVHEPGQFESWLDQASDFLARMSPVEAGALLYRSRGCMQCHSVDGGAGIAPTFKGLYGHEVRMADGSSQVADENYIRRSILEPNAQIVAGYPAVMPTYQGRLKDDEITAIIAYLKSLGE
jgi:cytochrome c oxidase subunit 2